MKKDKLAWITGLFVFLVLISFYFDNEIVKGFSFIRTEFLNELFLGINFLGSGIILLILLTVLFLFQKNKREWILPSWFAIFSASIISLLLKITVQRPRPFHLDLVSALPILVKSSYLSWDFSFPSAHTMIIFCAIPFLIKAAPKLKYLWVAFAFLIGFIRVYFGLHFLSDVLIGGLIGYIIGVVIIQVEEDNHFWEKIYNTIESKLTRK